MLRRYALTTIPTRSQIKQTGAGWRHDRYRSRRRCERFSPAGRRRWLLTTRCEFGYARCPGIVRLPVKELDGPFIPIFLREVPVLSAPSSSNARPEPAVAVQGSPLRRPPAQHSEIQADLLRCSNIDSPQPVSQCHQRYRYWTERCSSCGLRKKKRAIRVHSTSGSSDFSESRKIEVFPSRCGWC
jgi:hypothetical protein